MNEKITLSKLSVFLFGAFVFIISAYHTIGASLFWLIFILSGSLSFLSGILLRKNETAFKLKSIIFMSSSLILFPVFNFYIRDYPFNYCFIYPILIYLMFVAGHSLKFKNQILKSSLILFFSILFIASSYYYVPMFLFYVNKTETKKQMAEFELIDLKGNKITQESIKDKTIVLFFSGKPLEIDAISQKYSKNKDILVAKVTGDGVCCQNIKGIKRNTVYNSYPTYFDTDNKFLHNLNLDRKPSVILIDKNFKVRYIHVLDYRHGYYYYYKNLEKELDYLLIE